MEESRMIYGGDLPSPNMTVASTDVTNNGTQSEGNGTQNDTQSEGNDTQSEGGGAVKFCHPCCVGWGCVDLVGREEICGDRDLVGREEIYIFAEEKRKYGF